MVVKALAMVNASVSGPDSTMHMMELESLCAIAEWSSAVEWFAKSASTPTSLFTSLLKVLVDDKLGSSQRQLVSLLYSKAEEGGLVEKTGLYHGLDPLIAALKHSDRGSAVWEFLDNCAERCHKSTLKYLEMNEEHLDKAITKEKEKAKRRKKLRRRKRRRKKQRTRARRRRKRSASRLGFHLTGCSPWTQ